jgi:hypothetical protein
VLAVVIGIAAGIVPALLVRRVPISEALAAE